MRCHLLSNFHIVAFVALTLAGSFLGLASFAQADPTTAELRADLLSSTMRFSDVARPSSQWAPDHAERSFYVGAGFGMRLFPKQPHHGLLLEGQYRWDTDLDSLFDESGTWKSDFGVGRVGYAYRMLVHPKRRPDSMAWAFTPHASLSAGAVRNHRVDYYNTDYPLRSPVIGGRVGFDIDMHISRLIMGWGLSYEVLRHLSGGPLRTSHFISWNVIPVFRLGVTIGPKTQSLAR